MWVILGEFYPPVNPGRFTSTQGPSYLTTPAKKFGLFESPEAVVDAVFERLGPIEKGTRLLEPSAGRGRLALRARELGADVTCVEIQAELVTTLRGHGLRTAKADFLTLTPEQLGQYDIIVMNPPFDMRRDADHVRHALKFLAPGGRLIAVMSASAEFSEHQRAASLRELIEKHYKPYDAGFSWRQEFFRDLPVGSFKSEGTMVNTVTLGLKG